MGISKLRTFRNDCKGELGEEIIRKCVAHVVFAVNAYRAMVDARLVGRVVNAVRIHNQCLFIKLECITGHVADETVSVVGLPAGCANETSAEELLWHQ